MLLFYHWNTLLGLGQHEHQHGLQHWWSSSMFQNEHNTKTPVT